MELVILTGIVIGAYSTVEYFKNYINNEINALKDEIVGFEKSTETKVLNMTHSLNDEFVRDKSVLQKQFNDINNQSKNVLANLTKQSNNLLSSFNNKANSEINNVTKQSDKLLTTLNNTAKSDINMLTRNTNGFISSFNSNKI